jgi:hypothetical protein
MAKASKRKKASKTVYRPALQSFIPNNKLSAFGIAYSFAILCATSILALSLAAKYTTHGAITLEALKPFFLTVNTLQPISIISNMAEAALHGLVFGLVFTWLYNKLS